VCLSLTMRKIRPYDAAFDDAAVRILLAELQDYERALEPDRPSGSAAAVLLRVTPETPTDGRVGFAYLADLVVAEHHRGRGVGRALVAEVTELARAAGAATLEVGVLARNAWALKI
jgi:GNAT superfamily N-acetyltransferase